jgi:acyl-coenzyme A thioesterase PaaI-like protein
MTPGDLSELLNRNLPAVDHRGEIVEEVGPDFVRLRLPIVDSYLSHDLPAGSGQVVLSGPVTIGFAETSLYACVHAFYGARVFAATLSLNVSFLRLAGGADLIAVARLLRRGRNVAFAEAHLYSGTTDKPCAHITATYAVKSLEEG